MSYTVRDRSFAFKLYWQPKCYWSHHKAGFKSKVVSDGCTTTTGIQTQTQCFRNLHFNCDKTISNYSI